MNPEAPFDDLDDHWHEPPPQEPHWFWWVIIGLIIGVAFILLLNVGVRARDLGQWGNTDPAIKEWFRTLMQPDNPTSSCCGEADAYYADIVEVKDGQTIAVITDERDDRPLGRMHEDIGNKYVIPAKKIKFDKGNPTGHIIIFLSGPSWNANRDGPPKRDVYCYVMNGGI